MRPASAASATSRSSSRVLVESAAAAVARIRGSSSASIGRASDAASSLLIAPSAAIAPARTAASGSGEQPADVRRPAAGRLAARLGQRPQRARPHLRRLVIEEQRRHQVALVERLEDVDRIDDALGIRLRQLLHQRLDRREVGGVQPHLLGLDDALFDAAAERGEVFALGANGHDEPERRQRQADEAQLIPAAARIPTAGSAPGSAARPIALARRSTVTSTNGFTSWRSSLGSGRNSTSRVVLSTV